MERRDDGEFNRLARLNPRWEVIEPAMTVGSNILAEIPAYVAGMTELNQTGLPSEGMRRLGEVSEMLTYSPRTMEGQAGLQSLTNGVMKVMDALGVDEAINYLNSTIVPNLQRTFGEEAAREIGSSVMMAIPFVRKVPGVRTGLGAINADDLGRVNFPEKVPAPRELIKPTTKGKGGRIPGAPAHVKTPADEQRAIDNYLNEAELGAAGAFWYSNTARRIDRDVGNVGGARPGAADRAAAVMGEFSPRATLEANRLAQVRAFNQHATGLPVAAGMGPRNKAAQGILDTGEFSAQSALKVGPFSMQVRGLSVPRGVHDVRDIKSWGYGDAQGTGEANHRWMDKMQDQAVKLANERKLAGRSDWTHEQLQASRWVKHKADDMGVDIAALTDDFGPADQWLAANVFSEASPSQELMNAGALSAADVRIYTAMHQNLFTNPQGQDVLAHQLGLLAPDSTRFVGEWDGAFNPNIVTRIMADPAKGADVISEWSQEAIAFHGGLRGLLGGQADVATSFLRKPKLVGDTNAYRIPFDRAVTEADIASYKRAAQKALREADVPGDVVVNFRGDKELELTWLIFDETEKVQKKAFRNAIEGITGGRGIPARNSGGLLTYEDRFKPSAWMEKLQNPLMRSKVEDMLPRIAADIERDIAKLPLTDTGREIYQRTITLIKEGGLAAVENAVKQGILPAAVIGALLLGANQGPQRPFSSQGPGQPRT